MYEDIYSEDNIDFEEETTAGSGSNNGRSRKDIFLSLKNKLDPENSEEN